MKIKILNFIEIEIKKINKNYIDVKKEKCLKQEDMKYKEGVGKMDAKYSAMDVAMYIIEYANKKDKPITNLYVQKILYYIQANELTKNSKPLFNEKIMAWKYGPVVEEVYSILSSFGSLTINRERLWYNTKELDKDTKNSIEKIIDEKMKIPAWKLVQITHKEDPWYYITNNGENLNQEITLELIKEYFENKVV